MVEPSARFQRFGKPLTLDDVVKDCRELEEIILALKKTVESQQKALEALQQKAS